MKKKKERKKKKRIMIRKEIISHALGTGVKKEIHARYIKHFRIR